MTAPTGLGLTVTTDVPDLPSDDAVIVTVPAVIPVTRPVDDTVARDASLVAQLIARPVKVPPCASFTIAVSCDVCETMTSSASGETLTLATGTDETDTATIATLPSLVAVIAAPPGDTAVISPVALTVAIAVELLDHVTGRSVSTPPSTSSAWAVICFVPPT